MPRAAPDNELLSELLALEATVGSRSKLAVLLDVDRSTIWRFCKHGRALDKTKEAIREGLKRYRNETTSSPIKVSAAIDTAFTGNIREDMQMLRSLCTTVLTVLDGYEKLLANGTDNN